MILESFANLLGDELGLPIFVHAMSFDEEEGVLLRLPLEGVLYDHDLPGYHRCRVQAIVRAQSQERGDEVAKSVIAALTMYERTFTGDTGELLVKRLLPLNLPSRYPRSQGNGIEWSVNFDFVGVLS